MNKEYKYWFDSPEEHAVVGNYGKEYYGYKIIDRLVSKLEIPDAGYIVLLGSNRCVSLDLLCEMYGRERCIGYDLFNPMEHDRVITKDCNLLSDEDDLPIAFCHNDMGSFPTTPDLKIHVQKWAARNMIKGGVMLSRNNFNRAKFKSEDYMKSMGFKNTLFKDLDPKVFPLDILEFTTIEGHMFSEKL